MSKTKTNYVNTMEKTKLSHIGASSVLAILAVFVLFSATLSSCKKCGKNNKPAHMDDALSNTDNTSDTTDTALDTQASNATTDSDSPNPTPLKFILDADALSEVRRCLEEKGASNKEIEAMMRIGQEGFGEDIGHVIFDRSHFYYKDSAGCHNGQSGLANCGLYAVKRLVFVLGKHGKVPENAWYQDTDDELRKQCNAMENEMLSVSDIYNLLPKSFGVAGEYSIVYEDGEPMNSPYDFPIYPKDIKRARPKAESLKEESRSYMEMAQNYQKEAESRVVKGDLLYNVAELEKAMMKLEKLARSWTWACVGGGCPQIQQEADVAYMAIIADKKIVQEAVREVRRIIAPAGV